MPSSGGNALALAIGDAVARNVTDLIQFIEKTQLIEHLEGTRVESCCTAIHRLVGFVMSFFSIIVRPCL